jgi:hypothetical protein
MLNAVSAVFVAVTTLLVVAVGFVGRTSKDVG